ncbi:MAG: 23S rRNA (uracil(1939)-C(5))-methyltransferase RlmD [Elusimicrobiota bacterium]
MNKSNPREKHSISGTTTGTIEKLVNGGAGIIKQAGFTSFISYTCPGETVEFRYTQRKKSYGFGIPTKIITPSTARVNPRCPGFYNPAACDKPYCGGCDWQHMDYAEQLLNKQKAYTEIFSFIPQPEKIDVLPAKAAGQQYNYRNRTHFAVRPNEDNTLTLGFYAPDSHSIVEVPECYVLPRKMNTAVTKLKQLLRTSNLTPYNESRHSGTLRHVSLRYSFNDDSILAVLVTHNGFLPDLKKLLFRIRSEVPEIVSLYQNVNPNRTNVIFGNDTIQLDGVECLYDTIPHPVINELKFRISPLSFYQINTPQIPMLYDTIVNMLTPAKTDTVIDLYCGSGGIGLYLAPYVKQSYGVDNSTDSITDAIANLNLNKIPNCQFIRDDSEVFDKLIDIPDDTTIIIDPPRAGCSDATIDKIVAHSPTKIVYVSCYPSTLARDLKKFILSGYTVLQTQVVDMFPQTSHIESVTLLLKK